MSKETILEIKLSNAKTAYNNATCADVKKTIAAFWPDEEFEPKDVLKTINSIEDVFKAKGQDYAGFLEANKHLSESALNYALLEIGIAYLNQGWYPDFNDGNQAKWFTRWDMRGSGFVFSGSDFGYDSVYATVGSALRLKDQKTSDHSAKVFYPQYKGYYKPSAVCTAVKQ